MMDHRAPAETTVSLRYRCYRLRQRMLASLRHGCGELAQSASICLHRSGALPVDSGLIILDDYFPNLMTGFRISEYNRYLETFADCRVYTCDPQLSANKREYEKYFPQLAPRVLPWHRHMYLPGQLAYCIFLGNAFEFLPIIEKHKLPFVFTLYPGGSFRIDDSVSDRKLRRVCESDCFRGVIATQTITRDYLVGKGFCDSRQVEFIYGGVFPSDVFRARSVEKRYYGQHKDTFDICFVAHKYMPKGIDKGYDAFIEVARILASKIDRAQFHVIGGFGPEEIDVADLGDRIAFYGPTYRDAFTDLYAGMDLILSPNVPFRLFPGSFDGFPTGCCIEAGLCGAAVFATDALGCNVAFTPGEEIVIIPREPGEIAEIVCHYHDHVDDLYRIAANGQRAFATVFDLEGQMGPRIQMLARHLPARALGEVSPGPVSVALRS